MAEGEQMLGGLPCAVAVVDHDRACVRTRVDIDGHEGKPPPTRQLDEPVAVLHALHDEAVDQGAVDAPRRRIAIDGGDQRDARAARVADLGHADHEFAVERVVEEVAEVVHGDHADGIDPSGPQQTALRVRAMIAKRARRLLDPLANLGAHQPGLGKGVGRGPLGNPGRPGHIRQFHASLHRVIHTPSSEPIQFSD